jgi:glutamate synthase (NADPH) small chain
VGVKIETDVVIGRTLTVDDLFSMGFEALFIGTGAGLPRFLNIPGENLKGVYSANEYLTRVNLMKAYQPDSRTPIQKSFSVAVVGGGNVAMDAARCAMRMGADQVTVVYRRSMAELPARAEEVEHAQEEGIVFKMLTNPTEVLGDEKGWVTGLKCEMMALGEPDATGRRSPVPMPDSELTLPVDTLIVAVGTQPNPLIHRTTDNLAVDRHGCIVVSNENGLTSRPNIYAGGDAVTGAATVILAMGAGKHAAAAIHRAISEKTQRS